MHVGCKCSDFMTAISYPLVITTVYIYAHILGDPMDKDSP